MKVSQFGRSYISKKGIKRMSNIELVSSIRCFEGWQKQFKHSSETLDCEMHFSVYEPDSVVSSSDVPVVYWLSGLTCTDQNFVTKAGAQRYASDLGILLVAPDTSPRGESVPDAEDGAYDLGLGAGFYLNATQAPWSKHYRMYDYVSTELPDLIGSQYSVFEKAGLMGHSMGGHGALTIGLKNTDKFCSLSAFAPIVNPTACPWGQKAFSNYLGSDEAQWAQYDACALLESGSVKLPILIDQGLGDNFFESQSLTKPIDDLAKQIAYPMDVHYREGYDHSYFFIASYIQNHLEFHAQHLGNR